MELRGPPIYGGNLIDRTIKPGRCYTKPVAAKRSCLGASHYETVTFFTDC